MSSRQITKKKSEGVQVVREHSLCESDFDKLLWKEHSVTLTVILVLLHAQGGKGKVEYQQINFLIKHDII